MTLVYARDVVKTYSTGEVKVEALRKVSFEIEKSSLVAFVGPSGSGKTTLLNLIGCLDKPTSGGLVVVEMAVHRLNQLQAATFRGENIGFIFQNFNLIPVLTAFENIEYPLTMVQKLPTQERAERVTQLLEAVGMADQRNKFPDQLSGGQKQRVAVARALVTRPKLVLADEPTANLDHDTAYMIIQLMKEMTEEFHTAFIFSTHDSRIIGEAEVIYTLEDGRITNREVAHA
jgi:putative ABC transport system ATP-binding protein